MAVHSFKNVGEKTEDVTRQRRLTNSEKLPLGIVTPVRSGDDAEGIFKMHRNLTDQIRDNFKNLLLTNYGDRVVLHNFGANLQPLTFELVSQDDFDAEAMLRIKRATEQFMPFIELINFESSIIFPDVAQPVGRVNVKIDYAVPAANIRDQSITVTFFLGG